MYMYTCAYISVCTCYCICLNVQVKPRRQYPLPFLRWYMQGPIDLELTMYVRLAGKGQKCCTYLFALSPKLASTYHQTCLFSHEFWRPRSL